MSEIPFYPQIRIRLGSKELQLHFFCSLRLPIFTHLPLLTDKWNYLVFIYSIHLLTSNHRIIKKSDKSEFRHELRSSLKIRTTLFYRMKHRKFEYICTNALVCRTNHTVGKIAKKTWLIGRILHTRQHLNLFRKGLVATILSQ